MKKFLFVCTGNTCRSPMAEAIMNSFSLPLECSSAGLFADGSEYSHKSVAVLREIGITLCGNSRQLCRDDLNADRIFCMSDSHKGMLLSLGVNSDKITVLDVSDPFGGDIEVYRRCRDEIREKLDCFNFKLRRMRDTDIPAVAEIEKQCFSAPWSENALRESYSIGTVFFVAVSGERVVGYAGLQHTLDEGYVTNIATLPEYRGFGIGTRLTEALINYCEENGCAFITLEVRESNAGAIGIYEKAGFSPVGKRKNFYSAPREDGLIMTKVIKGEDTQH